ncbi:hypothetical protein HMN09_00390700 [Mycena chlorophos]|uniref:Ribosomal RNA-processing protein 4 n=1 Tax=Mycena chlorophos TaxID=658473 RepID=A0A8H6TKH0_MYCCL|nr:hypothetical protein HMN09_00390700 [Mycena chlorophos]
MFSFAPFRPTNFAAAALPDDDDEMDLDGDDVAVNSITLPGETITSSHAYMRGHGTYVDEEQVIASVAGTIERVNKLVTVRAISTKYNPEVGDLVVGRITEVQPRRWKVDANSRQDAVLMLSSVNLPGGVQRRKLESDELQMRTFFEEGDLLVAEVQAFFADGAMSLHTRSLKYGKLRNGQLVMVPPMLVRRLKSHFTTLPCGVDLILGLNGYIWVSKHVKQNEQEGEEGFDAETIYSNRNDPIDESTRSAISRVANIIRVLAAHFVPLTDTLLLEAYEWTVENDTDAKSLLVEDGLLRITFPSSRLFPDLHGHPHQDRDGGDRNACDGHTAGVGPTPLMSSVPAPFPRDLLEAHEEAEAGPSRVAEAPTLVQQELLPSINYVEKTCLMTLNNLLSGSTRWTPIVPERRHSMPSSATSSAGPQVEFQSSSALQTLVSNLRAQDPPDTEMVEIQGGDTALLHELRNRVEQMAPSLEPDDALLADTRNTTLDDGLLLPPGDLFNTLKRQLSDLQVERQSSQHEPLPPNTPPVVAVEKALLWSKIDEELDDVLALCKERAERMEHQPPQYEYDDAEFPPQYDTHSLRESLDEPKRKGSMQSPTVASTNEKMRLDLEAVTMAIDRLYLAAPQLHNQRVELKSSKLAQMEKARRDGASAVGRGKQKDANVRDARDLEKMLELIGKASERTLKDQSVILEGGMKSRLERARQRDVAKRDAFVEHLAGYSDAGRFHQQDAVLSPPRTKNPEAMLTLPEFIREPIPESLRTQDPNAMLTLPEFVKEMPPPHLLNRSPPPTPPAMTNGRSKPRRTRSMSASSLAWLRSSSSRSALKSEMNSSASIEPVVEDVKFSVTYVAEHHENLQHILVFLTVHGATPGVDIEAEVLPNGGDADSGGDYLVIKSGPHRSLPLVLPGRTTHGKQQVRVQGSHFEIKISTVPTTSSSESTPLLDATQLTTSTPSSFICASCSLPLVHSSATVRTYQDLPSEHWEELVDAWMCHSDQKLNERVMKQGRAGFWPESGQALVGGSYILFEEQAMVRHHLSPEATAKRGEDWRLVRCICGAVVGRCQEHETAGELKNVYRMLKYAIRPVSSSTEPSKLPLSAFIVEDMVEYVEAHASYRFIILDEEEERARILIWLFKPNMRLAYSTQTQYALPRSASIRTAKVLFKLLGPSEATTDLQSILNTYPGFPQAEYLFYPMDICRQLAAVLKESNTSYPETMRVMTGLEVGWLRRS